MPSLEVHLADPPSLQDGYPFTTIPDTSCLANIHRPFGPQKICSRGRRLFSLYGPDLQRKGAAFHVGGHSKPATKSRMKTSDFEGCITGRSYRLKDHSAIAGKEEKNKKIKSKANGPSTAELAS